MKIPFEQFIYELGIREGQKMNTCHSPNSGQFCSTGGGGTLSEYAQNVMNRSNYPGTVPSVEKQNETITEISSLSKITNNSIAKVAEKVGVSEGFAAHVAKIIKSDIDAGRATGNTSQNPGLTRIVDSSGRVKPRRAGG